MEYRGCQSGREGEGVVVERQEIRGPVLLGVYLIGLTDHILVAMYQWMLTYTCDWLYLPKLHASSTGA